MHIVTYQISRNSINWLKTDRSEVILTTVIKCLSQYSVPVYFPYYIFIMGKITKSLEHVCHMTAGQEHLVTLLNNILIGLPHDCLIV